MVSVQTILQVRPLNAEFLCDVMRRLMDDRERKRLDKRRRVLHQDNVPVHTALAGEQFLAPQENDGRPHVPLLS